MSKNKKLLSSPFLTGGGGWDFEVNVQASFVVLMLTGGFVPCLPCWPIKKIKLQGKIDGYDTDDMIVFVENVDSTQKRKILCQIKHSISITKENKVFGEVIQAAWNDFNNSNLFSKDKDAIALITGPLSTTDINDVRLILEWARHSEDANYFIKMVKMARISSSKKQSKLEAFKVNLKKANGGNSVSDEILFEFLKHFHILGYDLDIKAGVTLSLLHSLIGQYSQENALSLWAQIVEEVRSFNKNAGVISLDSISDDLQAAFSQRIYAVRPNKSQTSQLPLIKPNWNELEYASDLVIANLVGAWDESNSADLEIIHQLSKKDYDSWITKVREILQLPESPISLKNGVWYVTKRKELWNELNTRLFNKDLDNFKQCAITILMERNPKFDLPIEKRHAASVYGNIPKYSLALRKGIAESLALLGCQSSNFSNCSQGKPESIAVIAIRKILENADWILWGSLNNLLPLLAEAAPNEFLSSVENTLQQSPSPFDELFFQEGNGIIGGNYLTGLLWALESLAWDEEFLVRVTAILGDLASHDPGGKWANRPDNSLTTIFLPWLPQTNASINKRKVALQILQKEFPTVTWRILLKLLPNQYQVSSGTHKPSWRNTIPIVNKESIPKDYKEQVSFYAEMMVSMVENDMPKLNELISHLDNLPKSSFDKVLKYISSKSICNKSENEHVVLWTELTKFIVKHKRFSDAEWALSSDSISKIETIANKIAPKNPLHLYRRLFGYCNADLFEEKGNWEEQIKGLEKRQEQAVKKILTYNGLDGIIQFVEAVESPWHVGYTLGIIAKSEIDKAILPSLLETENKKLAQFVSSYVQRRQYIYSWKWVDGLDKSSWSIIQIGQFLSYMPFIKETWDRVTIWLGTDEKEYWEKTNVGPYRTCSDLSIAIDKLIFYGRPNSAIDCLYHIHFNKQPLDIDRSVKALLAAVSSKEPLSSMDTYYIVEIIRKLQKDSTIDSNDLFLIEWAYLPLLDKYNNASPKLLENRLASNPEFFCEVIRLIYRSEKEDMSKKRELNEHDKSIATNAWNLLNKWQTPPGMQTDGSFSTAQFTQWLEYTKKTCTESGHLEVALTHIGKVLFYCPPDSSGLWINKTVADALNSKDSQEMRNGFRLEVFNSRGVHMVDPTGKPELELAQQYKQKAEEVENAGFQHFAVTLRSLAESYGHDANKIIAEHKVD